MCRKRYYEEGWLATGNGRGVVGVTFTSSHCRRDRPTPQRVNFNLRGHNSEVRGASWEIKSFRQMVLMTEVDYVNFLLYGSSLLIQHNEI